MSAATTNNPVGERGYRALRHGDRPLRPRLARRPCRWRRPSRSLGRARPGAAWQALPGRRRRPSRRPSPPRRSSESPACWPASRTDLADIAARPRTAPTFERSVWQAARRIPCGEVRSYGEIAREIGAPGAAQAVGIALGRNPVPIIVPCHRVLAADGRSGGFSAPGGVATKFGCWRSRGRSGRASRNCSNRCRCG